MIENTCVKCGAVTQLPTMSTTITCNDVICPSCAFPDDIPPCDAQEYVNWYERRRLQGLPVQCELIDGLPVYFAADLLIAALEEDTSHA